MPSNCTSCKSREAVYSRPYSGEKLCSRCFCHSIENKVRETIAKYKMLRFDDKIVVGVSGGKDSMALLNILVKLEKAFPRAELIAVTVDEGISGYRDEALEIARKSCLKFGVEHIVVSFKELFDYRLDDLVRKLEDSEKRLGSLTTCSYCGVLRRRALNLAARDCGATKLATAHNLDDEAQTVLLNIVHGDPLRITRVKPVSSPSHFGLVCRVKPFCKILEREIALYAYFRKITFQRTPCPYAGAALRNDIRSTLNKMEKKHPGLKYTVYNSAEKLWSSMENSGAEKPGTCTSCGETTVNETCQPCLMLQRLKS